MGNNIFAYCLNNPIYFCDYTGQIAITSMFLLPLALTAVLKASEEPIVNPNSVPPDHPDFKPPKGGNKKKKSSSGKSGWLDADGNVWVWTPGMHGGEGWTIHHPDGGHGHAYPGGGSRYHCSGNQYAGSAVSNIFFGLLGTVVLVADDITGVGAGNDVLITVSLGMFFSGIANLFNKSEC